MINLIVRHKVTDYALWKSVFDEHSKVRKDAGSEGGKLFRSSENPNEMLIMFKWRDIDSAKKFANSNNLKEVMIEAGVIDKPDMYFVEKLKELHY